jgi:membrane glycosyltransferase
MGAVTALPLCSGQSEHVIAGLNAVGANVDSTGSEYHARNFVFSPKAEGTSWVASVFASEKRHLSIASVKAKF